jgi:hypothetical protein
MLVGAYPFEDPDDPKNIRKTIEVTTIYADVIYIMQCPPAFIFLQMT